MKNIELESKRCFLRKIKVSDIDEVFRGLSHPDVIRYYGVSFRNLSETKTQMKFYDDLINNDEGVWWAVCDKINNAFLGAIGFNDYNSKNKKAELGYWLHKENWGKGYMREILEMVCSFGFNYFNIDIIEAFIETENLSSIKLVLQNGFVQKELLNDYETKNGKTIDLIVFQKSRE